MKRNLIIALSASLAFMIASPARAGQLGAPEPFAKNMGVSLGAGYFFHSTKVQFQRSDKFTLDQNQIYAQLSATYRNAEGYLRLGGSDMRLKEVFATRLSGATLAGYRSDFEDASMRAFIGLGAKYKFDISKYFSLGPSILFTLFDTYEDKTTGTVNALETTQSLKIKGAYKMEGGLLAQLNFGPLHLYAGPMLYWFRSDIESASFHPDVTGDKMKETGNFGGVGGIRVKLPFGLNAEIEAQYAERFSAGGLISYAF